MVLRSVPFSFDIVIDLGDKKGRLLIRSRYSKALRQFYVNEYKIFCSHVLIKMDCDSHFHN